MIAATDAVEANGKNGLLPKGSYVLQVGIHTYPRDWPEYVAKIKHSGPENAMGEVRRTSHWFGLFRLRAVHDSRAIRRSVFSLKKLPPDKSRYRTCPVTAFIRNWRVVIYADGPAHQRSRLGGRSAKKYSRDFGPFAPLFQAYVIIPIFRGFDLTQKESPSHAHSMF